MSTLVVVGFDSLDGAKNALGECRELEKEYLLDLEDAVVVRRTADGKVHLDQSINLEKVGASWGFLSGGFWGALVGLLFLNPLAGLVVGSVAGAGIGALDGKFSDYGINDDFIKNLGATLTPGSSALFVLIRKAEPEKVIAHLSDLKGHAKIIQTSLSPEAEGKLRTALGQVVAAT
ncbi:DUF1269 domain-containing protein [Acetobacter conturbans]|uniref:DUF1269 domain-containing protein n=1 Tax=Acetobacter conturbans TaxID=1737472 RepID=A0ABX0JXL2_9PROT|nr:DUF1269 domain-containing protein [Acetobacter conturbans]NHN87720.1 DUF1269 domain-containing protein [Acetobacter conturbans]